MQVLPRHWLLKHPHRSPHFFMIVICTFILSLSHSDVSASTEENISVYTEQFYPMNYTADGNDDSKIIGYSTEFVIAVLETSKLQYKLEMVPWARAINSIDNNRNTIVFSMTRSPKRENQYHWIGDIWPTRIFVFGLRTRFKELPRTLDEIKALRVGVTNSSVAYPYFLEMGFTNLHIVKSFSYLRLLERNRIDLFPFVGYSAKLTAERQGYDKNDIVPLFELKELSKPLSIAMSKSTDLVIVERLRKAFHTVRQSDKYTTIMQPLREEIAKLEMIMN